MPDEPALQTAPGLTSGHLSVVGWEELQHYKDRDPVWIKLYRKLLDNYEWSRLQDASKSHLIGIWLLAARHANRIPADPEWIARRIGATDPVLLEPLARAGFIELTGRPSQASSATLASGYAREREEAEVERESDDSDTQRARVRFANPVHESAYQGFRRAARNPSAVEAEIAAVADGMPGHGPGFGWGVVGQALQELAAAGSAFSSQGLRAFARKVRDRKPADQAPAKPDAKSPQFREMA